MKPEWIVIKDMTYNVAVKRYACPVGKYLAAVESVGGYKIFKLKQGKPFCGVVFPSLEDCIGAINAFSEIYGDYFPIWENDEWEDADIPALCRWSVKNGMNLYNVVQEAERTGNPILCSSLHQEM